MSLTGSENVTERVGTDYTLTCTVILSHRARDSSFSIQWQGPSTDEQTTVDRVTSNELIVNEQSLDPLSLADGGDYTCTALYSVDGHTATIRSDVRSVIPISEFKLYPQTTPPQ